MCISCIQQVFRINRMDFVLNPQTSNTQIYLHMNLIKDAIQWTRYSKINYWKYPMCVCNLAVSVEKLSCLVEKTYFLNNLTSFLIYEHDNAQTCLFFHRGQ